MKFVISTSFSTVAHLTKLAPVADQCGWDAMSFSDHVVHPKQISTPYPYTENGERRWKEFTDWPDPLVMIGALSTITTRLHFMNNIFVLPMRNPFLVAKAAGTDAANSNLGRRHQRSGAKTRSTLGRWLDFRSANLGRNCQLH